MTTWLKIWSWTKANALTVALVFVGLVAVVLWGKGALQAGTFQRTLDKLRSARDRARAEVGVREAEVRNVETERRVQEADRLRAERETLEELTPPPSPNTSGLSAEDVAEGFRRARQEDDTPLIGRGPKGRT